MKNITFINAGAGSGKTYRLTSDLARKLTRENIDPSQVILTTYTELAAEEFREARLCPAGGRHSANAV